MPNRSYKQSRNRGHFNEARDQNDGVEGVVYILRNEAFQEKWIKIGQSRHSGHKRAKEMNKEASTGIPKHHVCIFECRTLDCARAERAVFLALKVNRRGPQEFFEVDLEIAKKIIRHECARIDEETKSNKMETEKKRFSDEVEPNGGSRPPSNQEASAKNKIDVSCPNCKTTLTAPAVDDTKRIRCPVCKFVFSKAQSQSVVTVRLQRELAGAWPLVFGAICLIIFGMLVVDHSRRTAPPEKSKLLVVSKNENTQPAALPPSQVSVANRAAVPPIKAAVFQNSLTERLRQQPPVVIQLEKGEAWVVSALISDEKRIRLIVQFRSKINDDLMIANTVDNASDMLKPSFCGASGLLSTYGLKSFSVSLIAYENDVRLGEIPLPKEFCATRLDATDSVAR